MTDHQELQNQLKERLASLEHRVAGLEGDLRSAHSQDWEERASEISGDEVLEGLEGAALDEIAQIRAALKRIKDGEYGACHNCAKHIGAKRLAALPFAVLCIDCASQAGS
ncbi:MAG: TraR/DksA C4-type zinc finger protein [Proteobacteria bacterium]|nr:TraR/DksA C4-type zinc finger protein [Pseudomonadota bacterium]MDA1357517.1 TraR/DksA C4-type zinc finger protein [Pseudomonadota bacterium]